MLPLQWMELESSAASQLVGARGLLSPAGGRTSILLVRRTSAWGMLILQQIQASKEQRAAAALGSFCPVLLSGTCESWALVHHRVVTQRGFAPDGRILSSLFS